MAETRYVFHVGPFKTGTTYLQHCLTSARAALESQGIVYPTAFISPRNKTMHIPLCDAARRGEAAEMQRVFREIEAAAPRLIVFSCEHFIDLRAEALERLREAAGGRPIEVVYYLRRWSDRLPSLWGQELRMGGAATLPQYCMDALHAQPESELVDYATSLDRLSAVFGRAALRIVPYSAQTDAKDDIFTAFCRDILGLAAAPAVSEEGSTLWGALDMEHTEILRALNTIHRERVGAALALPRQQFFNRRDDLDLAFLKAEIGADKAELLLDDSHASFAPARARLAAYADRVVAPYRDQPMLPPRARRQAYASGAYLLRPGVVESLQDIYGLLVRDDLVEKHQEKRRAFLLRRRAERAASRRGQRVARARAASAAQGEPASAPLSQAEAALQDALQTPPGHGKRTTKKDWIALFASFEAIHATHPDFAPAYVQHVEALLQLRWKEAALRIASHALASVPRDVDVRVAYVRAALAADQTAAAREEIGRLLAEHPQDQTVLFAHIQLLMETGETARADALAREMLTHAPRFFRAWKAYARIAGYRGDWQAVADRWEEARPHFPDQQERIDALVAAARFQLDPPPHAAPAPEAGDGQDVFARFESLGGVETGCEFGLVQRRFGFEALGLLRWASIGTDQLIDGLESDFEGLGTPDQTFLTIARQEYGLRDRRYGFFTHTFVKMEDMPEDKMLAQSCRRLQLLRRKLLEDVAAGEKIFAYKLASDSRQSDAVRLFVSLRRHGPCVLVCFALADDAHAPGTWRRVLPDLFIGYVGHFMSSAESKAIDAASYEAVCREVTALLLRAA